MMLWYKCPWLLKRIVMKLMETDDGQMEKCGALQSNLHWSWSESEYGCSQATEAGAK